MIANFIKEVTKFYKEVYQSNLDDLTLEQLQKNESIMVEFYSNPIVWNHSTTQEQFYSFLSYLILGFYPFFVQKKEVVCKKNLDFLESLIDCYDSKENTLEIKTIVLDRLNDISLPIDSLISSITEIGNPIRNIVMNADLNTYNYLYYYGYKITENHKQIVDYFNKLSDETIDNMAKCTIDSFERGINKMAKSGVDISNKKYVSLIFPIGFEKCARRICLMLYGKYNVVLRIIEDNTSFDKQLAHNHRYDYNFYITKEYVDLYLDYFKNACQNNINIFKTYAGPIQIDSFGEKRFIPENGHDIFEKDKELTILRSTLETNYVITCMEKIRKDTSFEIISYPCPEIGEHFEEIFNDTILLNTLDDKKYEKIHQNIIDVLDISDSVHVTGKGHNKTDLLVKLAKLSNPEKETKFENCTADINVPVGEVFTSPVLNGTNGTLHVSEIYLNGWKFKDLMLKIKDGMIEEYSCSNFETQKENTEYINEHLLYDHKTLPMGEFAIGTNTHAYVMGNKYQINDKLDILIAEKTGPHFAFGDTCYSMNEDNKVYNPDGKEVIAKDNEISIKRDKKSYFGCHTDVTIPYYELNSIVAIGKENIPIIQDGKFVLPGTEELNIEGM